MNLENYVTIKFASKLLGVDKTTLRRWDKQGKLKPYRHPINGYRLYLLSDIEDLIRSIKK